MAKLSSDNNLLASFQAIAKQWHPTKNGNLKPQDVTPSSDKKVWWVCDMGHVWNRRVASVTPSSQCQYCSGRRASPEHNLAVLYPDVAAEWHPTKNGNLKPEYFTPGSDKKPWWRCVNGHEWAAGVKSRTRQKNGCRYCAGQRATPESNLLVQFPDVAKEWHPSKNGGLKPENFTPGSSARIWWRCDIGHEWALKINDRVRSLGCKYCSRWRASPEYNLAVLYPDVAKTWHPEKNGDLGPQEVTPRSDRKVWWLCDKGHEWEATISNRTIGHGCRYCGRQEASPEYNLAVLYPDVAREWHPEKNGSLRPEDFLPGTRENVWWRCDKGHEWTQPIKSRVAGSKICQHCARRRASPEYNLPVLYPDVAKEWHPEKNGNLKPEDLGLGSLEQVWWLCDEGHEWVGTIAQRLRYGAACRLCFGRGKITGP